MKKTKNHLPSTGEMARMGYDTIVDRSTEVNIKSKHQATTGIDLVTKGTISKSKAEKLLFEAKDLAIQGESLKVRGSEILTDSKNLETIGTSTREEYKNIMLEVDATYRKYIELKRNAEHKLDVSEKALQDSEIKYSEGTEYVGRGQSLVDRANSLLQEANILNENANKWIEEGNTLIDNSKIDTNSQLKELAEYNSSNFTIEAALNTIADTSVEAESVEPQKSSWRANKG